MIFLLEKVSGGIDKINDVPLVFLENVSFVNECSENILPIWFRKVYRKCPGVKERFEKLFSVFKKLNKQKQRELLTLYRKGKDIKNLCADSFNMYPTILNIDKNIKEELIDIFNFLYEKTINTEVFREQSSMHINDHYEKFQEINNVFVCPFCGIESYTLPKFRRAEYDHFLPISLYPWLGVNFNNLVPMGDHCNGKKSSNNVLYSDKKFTIRRKVWYPYEWIDHNIKIQCLQKPTLKNIEGKWNFIIAATDLSNQDKIDTWNNVFEISDRFSEIISKFHARFIEDFAHKNGIKKERLTPFQIKAELKKFQEKGIGNLSFEPLAKLKFLWSSHYIHSATDAELAIIAYKVAYLPERKRP